MHRVPCEGNHFTGFTRYVHCRCSERKADDKYLNKETGKFELAGSNPLVYVHGGYFDLGTKIGKFGWSVEKEKE